MKFTLEIELGNDAMQTAQDVLIAMSQTFYQCHRMDAYHSLNKPETGLLRDINGNTVGKWEVTE